MDKMVYETALLNAIIASVKNHEWCSKNGERKISFFYKAEYIIWYLLLIVISPHKENTSCKMVCAMTPVNEKRLLEYAEDVEMIRLAKLNMLPSKMRKNYSFFSPYSIKKRCMTLYNATIFYFKYRKKLNGYLHFTLEYYGIAKYILEQNISEIISPCMYDRYCTFLSYFSYSNGIKLIGVQDGAAIDIDVPNKIYCNQMNCFDEFEAEIIKHFISNEDCKFVYTGFKSMLNWSNFEKNGKYTIAIASQDWHTRKTLNLLDIILKKCDMKKYNIIVFPHYRENLKQYEPIKKMYPELILEKRTRYRNIDLLITFYSTIVYDYWAVNQFLPIKCLKINGYKPSYYDRYNVSVYDDADDLVNSIE